MMSSVRTTHLYGLGLPGMCGRAVRLGICYGACHIDLFTVSAPFPVDVACELQ
jgi:hypothetical protein